LLEHGALTIQSFVAICLDVDRRTLQRDLKATAKVGLLVAESATNRLVYRPAE